MFKITKDAKIVKDYVLLIKAGKKNIEDVPDIGDLVKFVRESL